MKTARRVAGASAVVLAALAAFATEAARATPCTDSVAAAPVFDAWGDPRAYDEVPGGSFEGGLAWTPTGAAGLAPAVDFPAADGTNSTAAHLEADDASITSPAFCVNDHDPSVRFLARAPEPGSHLKVAVLWTEADGKEKAKQIADLDAKRYSSAIPSATLALRDIVPRDGTRDVRLMFRMDGGSGSWLVDGVYMSRTATPACADVQATPVFAPWGDWDQYVALTGGTFEGPLSWATTGETAIVSESNPHPIGGSGRRALKISGMGSATSPPMCLDSRYPHFRFFARALAPGSKLRVAALWTDPGGKQNVVALDAQGGKRYTAWGISGRVEFRSALPKPSIVRQVQLRFYVTGGPEEWLIDDVYVDPYKRN